jgi:hypothetical protein
MSGGATKNEVFRLILWIVLIGGTINAVVWLAKSNYLPHFSRAYVMYPARGWEVGQYVPCTAQKQTTGEVDAYCNGVEYNFDLVRQRQMDVRFWGEVTTKPKLYTCKRAEDLITYHLPKN